MWRWDVSRGDNKFSDCKRRRVPIHAQVDRRPSYIGWTVATASGLRTKRVLGWAIVSPVRPETLGGREGKGGSFGEGLIGGVLVFGGRHRPRKLG
jgi:hypothetical protein